MLHRLTIENADATSIAPYGRLVAADMAQTPRSSAFYGDKVELWSLPGFQTDADSCLSVARTHPRPNEVIWMERHFKHTQTFVPLGGQPFVMVLGAPTETSAPDPGNVRAFRFDGSAGVMLFVGTWHEFPFAVSATTDVLVILRNETNRDLEVRENDEALGGDLEKRNLRARLGFGFCF